MMKYYVGTLGDADELATLCKKYEQYLVIDVKKGRYVVDGCSVLGVISFSGNWVDVDAMSKTDNDSPKEEFYKELETLINKNMHDNLDN